MFQNRFSTSFTLILHKAQVNQQSRKLIKNQKKNLYNSISNHDGTEKNNFTHKKRPTYLEKYVCAHLYVCVSAHLYM